MKSALFHAANIIAVLTMVLCSFMMTGCGGKENPWGDKIDYWQGRQILCEENAEELEGDLPKYSEVRGRIESIVSAGHPLEYVAEPEGHDFWKTSDDFIDDGKKGDCEDIATYFYHRIRAARFIPDAYMYLRVVPREDGKHILLVVETDQRNIVIDWGLVRHEMSRLDQPAEAEFNLFYSY